MLKRFCGFVINIQWADKELWYIDQIDGSRQYHIFDISIVKRKLDRTTYFGLQIIVLKLLIGLAHHKISIEDALSQTTANQPD